MIFTLQLATLALCLLVCLSMLSSLDTSNFFFLLTLEQIAHHLLYLLWTLPKEVVWSISPKSVSYLGDLVLSSFYWTYKFIWSRSNDNNFEHKQIITLYIGDLNTCNKKEKRNLNLKLLGILRGGWMGELGIETRKQKGKKMMNKDSRLKAKQNVHLQMKSFNSKLLWKWMLINLGLTSSFLFVTLNSKSWSHM